ncbi:MAG: peptidylprolyl isomerase [Gammaproteobacteria bacterium]|jgi:peptidyl-prolyl cis-trans isomerase SurA
MKYFPLLPCLFLLLAASAGMAQEQAADPIELPPETSAPAPADAAASGQESAEAPQRYLLNRIVAIVNGDVITYTELQDAITDVVAQLQEKGTPIPAQGVLTKQVLERLVVEKLQLQIAEQNGITIDDNTLNNEIRDLARQSGMSLTQFREVLERDGYSYLKFREDLRKQLAIRQVRRQMVASRITVSDQEVENLLATLKTSGQGDVQYHLAHILIAIPEAASPEEINASRQRAESVLESVRGGANFEQTAIAESDGQNALEGGDLGWRNLGQIPSLFVDVVKDMSTGDISNLIRSSSGFHIIKLLDKRGEERHMVKQTRARHILLKTDELNSDEAVRLRLEQLEIRLRSGEDFATLALTNSQDTLSAAKGGDLGWLSQGDTVPEFQDAMDKLAPGEISSPVKTQFGWHIIQVTDRREHDSTVEYERARAKQLIQQRKYDEELFLWLRRLRDESYVEYRLAES